MKILYILAILNFITLTLKGQEINTVVHVLQPQSYFLNGSKTKGKSRITLPIQLPKNTREWYFEVSCVRTSEQVNQVKSKFNLFGNVSKVFDKTGISKSIINLLTSPPGSDYCDVFLLYSQKEYDNFRYGGQFSYENVSSRKNFKNGVIPVTSEQFTTGIQYLAFRNSSNLYGIEVIVEVVAIVGEDIKNSTNWAGEERQELYDDVLFDLLEKGVGNVLSINELKKISNCITSDIVLEKEFRMFKSLANYEKEILFKEHFEQCQTQYPKLERYSFYKKKFNRSKILKDYRFLGKWKDNNSTYTLFPSGVISIFFDDGNNRVGKWEYNNNYLSILIDGTTSKYKILSFKDDEFISKGVTLNDDELYFTTRQPFREQNYFSGNEFIGLWKDENSKFVMNNDRTIIVQFDSGGVIRGRWKISGNRFTVVTENSITEYEIIEFSSNRFIYQSLGGKREVFLAKRL